MSAAAGASIARCVVASLLMDAGGGTRARGTLLRVLGVGFGVAVTVGNTIGAGILRAPGEVAAQLPAAGPFLAVWLAGGLLALLGAMCLGELGAMMPRSGGYYVFAHRALGDFPGFVVGWTDWLGQCGTIAAASILVGEYAATLLGERVALHPVALALVTAVGLALLQARGIRWGGAAQNLTSLAKGVLLLALVVALSVVAPAAAPAPAHAAPTAGAAAVLLALQAVIYTYDGWYGIIYFGEEVRRPGRDVPRSMIGGVLLVIAIYLLVNLALVHTLPMAQLSGDPLAVARAAELVFGGAGGAVTRAIAIVSLVGCINATHLMASRIPLALSRDGLLPPALAHVNRGGTPGAGLWLGTAAAAFFILTGSFRDVVAIMAFFFVANYVVAFIAIFVLRRREPDAPRPFRAWGHPVTTAVALIASLAFLAAAIAADTQSSVRALVVLAASYPVYRLVRGFGSTWRSG